MYCNRNNIMKTADDKAGYGEAEPRAKSTSEVSSSKEGDSIVCIYDAKMR